MSDKKTIELIELKPTKLIAVKIPDNVGCLFMSNHQDSILFHNGEYGQIDLTPKEKFKLVGTAKSLREDSLKEFIFSHGQRSGLGGMYSSYPRFDKENPELGTSSIKHSFQCLMRSHGLYDNEKYGVGIIEKDNYAIVVRESAKQFLPPVSEQPIKSEGETADGFSKYKKKQVSELRPFIKGEVLPEYVSISQADKDAGSPKAGDMIARNPINHNDQWLVAEKYFNDNFERANEKLDLKGVEEVQNKITLILERFIYPATGNDHDEVIGIEESSIAICEFINDLVSSLPPADKQIDRELVIKIFSDYSEYMNSEDAHETGRMEFREWAEKNLPYLSSHPATGESDEIERLKKEVDENMVLRGDAEKFLSERDEEVIRLRKEVEELRVFSAIADSTIEALRKEIQMQNDNCKVAIEGSNRIIINRDAEITRLESTIEQLRGKADIQGEGWIDVNDRLPETRVVVQLNTEFNGHTKGFYENGVWRYQNNSARIPMGITHWMPLPQPPVK